MISVHFSLECTDALLNLFQRALQHWGAQIGFERKEDPREKMRERPVVLRRRREGIKSEANWKLFYFQFTRDHAILNLIWNHLVNEISYLYDINFCDTSSFLFVVFIDHFYFRFLDKRRIEECFGDRNKKLFK